MIAANKTEFMDVWKAEMFEMKKLRWSLPDSDIAEFNATIDAFNRFIERAANHTFGKEVSNASTENKA